MPDGREVTFVDHPGVTSSSGAFGRQLPRQPLMIAFLITLDLSEIDLLGFSIGGFVAQQIALTLTLRRAWSEGSAESLLQSSSRPPRPAAPRAASPSRAFRRAARTATRRAISGRASSGETRPGNRSRKMNHLPGSRVSPMG
jgi:pimeloyl-ACP methyl ester carboxylesterase